MQVKEAGHIYQLDVRETIDKDFAQQLIFVNKEPGREHPGTTTQEVLRALIDRTRYCNNCLPHPNNDRIIYHLQMALILHESRALERKVQKGELLPECVETTKDGHYHFTMKPLDPLATTVLKPYTPERDATPQYPTGPRKETTDGDPVPKFIKQGPRRDEEYGIVKMLSLDRDDK
jgi:hypothetical protein